MPVAVLTEVWRLLPYDHGSVREHLARVEALVRHAASRPPSVWWHSTDDVLILAGPGIERRLGTGLPAATPTPDQGRPVRPGEPLTDGEDGRRTATVLRRPTGGGAVLTGPGLLAGEAALPAGHPLLTGDVVEDYRWLGSVWCSALMGLGVRPALVGVAEARRSVKTVDPEDDLRLACFGLLSPFEVTVNGRKLVGLSQVRRRGGVVFSWAIHTLMPPSDLACRLDLPRSRQEALASGLRARAASLSELGVRAGEEEVMRAFRQALRQATGVHLRRGRWTRAETRE
ncbi:MAG TPA: hypothetical protein VFB34_01600 [Chloroflexota bacterium]|nr:hypothetical protein [Chloroflexota bacterium]